MYDYTKKPENWNVPKYFKGYVSTSRTAYYRAARKLFKQLADDDLDLAYQLEHFLNDGTIENGTLYELQSYFHVNEVQAIRLAKIAPANLKNEILDSSEGRDMFKQLADEDQDLAYQLEHFLKGGRIGYGTLYELQDYFRTNEVQADRLANISPAYLHNEILYPFVNDDPRPDRYFP